ncbi:DUF167 domain-containing protein [Rhizobiales bacterium RZME27]|uniref:UPF0235 protein GAO09_17880 n=1 Tax=Endobacterium cereale TaxID=2663029 RepID=A0A6A8AAZ1_9HYPH|nr:DUF167 domain-containing protein [Endobacterium cereale]MEB2847631.1 DUF167 domain-containing protein [Endobacterium cereale]MQY47909.1 DUF167 domain-containing protein [Endobacterium cereale]
MKKPFNLYEDHLRLSIRLTPNGGRDSIEGMEVDAEGHAYLKARVSAVPEDGKANKALIALLSKKLRLPKSAISVISGETARKKILRIDGDPEDLKAKMEGLTA